MEPFCSVFMLTYFGAFFYAFPRARITYFALSRKMYAFLFFRGNGCLQNQISRTKISHNFFLWSHLRLNICNSEHIFQIIECGRRGSEAGTIHPRTLISYSCPLLTLESGPLTSERDQNFSNPPRHGQNDLKCVWDTEGSEWLILWICTVVPHRSINCSFV